ncbi:hypothetical protein [Inquilinus sp. OTU3971]|uniref:hypothetical protein n=1 Tax=Inquilinus sp. OTU3971 TaxID=3043855 RepID=UPI00313F0EDB
MDGKLEAYSASLGQLSTRLDLLGQRDQAQKAAAKEGRQARQSFQTDHEGRLGQLEQRVDRAGSLSRLLPNADRRLVATASPGANVARASAASPRRI